MGEDQIYVRTYFGHLDVYIFLTNHNIADVYCAEDCCEGGTDLLWTGEDVGLFLDYR